MSHVALGVSAALVVAVSLVPFPRSASAATDPALLPGDYALVSVASGTASRVARVAQVAGATDASALDAIDLVTARLSAGALAALRSDPAVRLIAADGVVRSAGGRDNVDQHGNNGEDGQGVNAVAAPRAWFGSTGRHVTVALLDTGIEPHPDIAGSVLAHVDFVRDGPKALDPGGHGTHLAGLIAAHGPLFRGVAPDAKLVSLRVLDRKGEGTLHGVLAAIDWLLRNRRAYGIRVANFSFGATQTTSYQQDILAAATESVWFSGIVVVAAAGNDGPHGRTVTTPGSDPFVLTVGSLNDRGTSGWGDDRESSFSSRGPTIDGFVKPDVLAPGERVRSLRVQGSTMDQLVGQLGVNLQADGPNALYTRMSGSSVSSAVVAGIAALVVSAHPTYTTTQVKGAIVGGAHRVQGSSTPGADAANALTGRLARVNVGLKPSRVLLDMLAKNGVSIQAVTWEGISWETVGWEMVSWEGVTWEGVNWERIAWESRS